MAEITSEEFERWMTLIREDIQGVHKRLDGLNGRTRTAETKIAVLEDRANEGRTTAALWGSGMGSAAVAVIEGIKLWISK